MSINFIDILAESKAQNANLLELTKSYLNRDVIINMDFINEGKLDMDVIAHFNYVDIFDAFDIIYNKHPNYKPTVSIYDWLLFVKSINISSDKWVLSYKKYNNTQEFDFDELSEFLNKFNLNEKITVLNNLQQ